METTAVLAATVALTEAASEVAVIEYFVELGREMFSASFGASLLVDDEGQLTALAHTGMSTAEVAALPHLPRPVGLLGVVLGGETLRLDDLSHHPGAVGLPAGHVEMVALLAAPITAEGRVVGGVWFTRRRDEGVFGPADEERVTSLARIAGTTVVALQRREATRALVGGFADGDATDSDLIHRLMTNASDLLDMDLTFLAGIQDGEQVFSDLRQGSDGTAQPEGLEIDQADGVAVRLPDGTLYGTLTGLSPRTGTAPSATQMAQLHNIAELVGAAASHLDVKAQKSAEAARAFSALFSDERHEVHLQPIVDLTTGCPVGYEALSRFTDAYGAPRRPDHVFAQAAELGLGIDLEQTAVRKALENLPDLPASTYLSVNLSPRALLAPSTFDLLTEAVDSAEGRLVVEMTEHEQVTDYPALLKLLSGLRERGLRLAIDDTGAGICSLQHVTAMHPDIIKLDMVFVRNVHLDPSNRAVARALTTFAADMGASFVAEGIETKDELDELMALGTVLGQGYLLGRPAPVSDILQRISAH